MIKKKILNDIILIAAVLLIAAIGLTAYMLFRAEGEKVVVTVNGKPYATYRLNDTVSEEIISENGRNMLIIKNGKVKITEASCPDLVCVHHRAISLEGDVIVCLPNKVVVSIE